MEKLLYIVEKCNVSDTDTGEESEGKRFIRYATDKDTLQEALKDFEENFDFDKMEKSEDEFSGECIGSEILTASFDEDIWKLLR